MKRLLIISPYLPFPLDSGGSVAQFYFLKQLQHIFDITFITTINNINELAHSEELRNHLTNINFEFLKYYTETEYKPSFILRTKVYVVKLFNKGVKNKIRDEAPVLFVFTPHLFKSFVQNYVNSNNFDFIQCEFFETLDLIDLLPRNITTIFIHHEIRFKAIELQKSKNIPVEEILKLKHMELEYLNKYKKIVVFNSNDKVLIEKNIQKNNVIISEFGVTSANIYKNHISEVFNKLIFIGSQTHYSNYEGLKWFLNNIYLPNYYSIEAELIIVGKWREDFKSVYKQYSKIKFLGFVENLGSVFENAVLVNPILSGSGIRTKVLEAFANKVPVISTAIGAEGLYCDNEQNHLMIFENENDFLNINYNHFSDKKLTEISKKGFNYYQENFNEETLLKKRMKVYE